LPAEGYGSSVLGYHGFIGSDTQFTADQVGGEAKLSVIWGYGLRGVRLYLLKLDKPMDSPSPNEAETWLTPTVKNPQAYNVP